VCQAQKKGPLTKVPGSDAGAYSVRPRDASIALRVAAGWRLDSVRVTVGSAVARHRAFACSRPVTGALCLQQPSLCGADMLFWVLHHSQRRRQLRQAAQGGKTALSITNFQTEPPPHLSALETAAVQACPREEVGKHGK
jgi:hypothetical protein